MKTKLHTLPKNEEQTLFKFLESVYGVEVAVLVFSSHGIHTHTLLHDSGPNKPTSDEPHPIAA